MKKRHIAIKVDPELFRKIKLYISLKDMNLHEYILGLIQKDMNSR